MRSLRLSHEQVQQIVNDVVTTYPNEACGLIDGEGDTALDIVPVENISSTPDRHFLMNPDQQLKALVQFEKNGMDWLAVYHSHPQGKPHPSLQDIQDATLNTPNIIHLIVGYAGRRPKLQAWHIHDSQVEPVELLIGKQASRASRPPSRLEVWAVIFAIALGIVLLLSISFTLLPAAPPLPTPQ